MDNLSSTNYSIKMEGICNTSCMSCCQSLNREEANNIRDKAQKWKWIPNYLLTAVRPNMQRSAKPRVPNTKAKKREEGHHFLCVSAIQDKGWLHHCFGRTKNNYNKTLTKMALIILFHENPTLSNLLLMIVKFVD